MENQDQTTEQEYRLKPQMPDGQDQSPAAQLARAIAAKDVHQVQELVKTVKLTGKYLGSFWSHRVVDDFDPEVAKVMEQAKMRLSYPRQLLSLALHNDNPQAYLWLLEHPSLKKFFAQEQPHGSRRYGLSCAPWYTDNNWQIPVYQRDKSFVDPFFIYGGAPKIMTALLDHPRAEFYKHAIGRNSTFDYLAKSQHWDGFDLLLTKLVSWFGPQATRSKLSAAVKLYTRFDAAHYFVELEQQIRKRSNSDLFSSIFPLHVNLENNSGRWVKATGQTVEDIPVNSVAQACMAAVGPCFQELMKNPENAKWYKDMLVSKHGVALMSQLARSSFSTIVVHVIDELLPAMEKWEKSSHNPNGYTPAQVMLLASNKVGLAEYFLTHKPDWATRQVGSLPPALDMVDLGSVDARRASSKARLRKKALEIKSKSVRGGKKQIVPAKPKVFM